MATHPPRTSPTSRQSLPVPGTIPKLQDFCSVNLPANVFGRCQKETEQNVVDGATVGYEGQRSLALLTPLANEFVGRGHGTHPFEYPSFTTLTFRGNIDGSSTAPIRGVSTT